MSILTSARLQFERFRDEDAPALAELLADTSITRNITSNGSSPERCLNSARKRISWHNESWESDGYGVWALRSRDTALAPDNTLLGWCGFVPPDDDSPDPEILYAVRAECRGQGVAREAACRAIDWLFSETDHEGVTAVLFARLNPGSAAVVRKLGMLPSGRMDFRVFLSSRELADEVAEYEIWRLAEGPAADLAALIEEAAFRSGQLSRVTGLSEVQIRDALADSLRRRCARIEQDFELYREALDEAFDSGRDQSYMDCFYLSRRQWRNSTHG